MSSERTQIVIIGGGIAGCAAALALTKAGFSVVVCEAHPRAGGGIGAFLTLASNGMRALAQIDAAAAVAGVGFELTGMSALDQNGTELVVRPMGEPADPLTRFRCLRWSELTAALQAEVNRRGIALRHGAALVSAAESADGVTAELSDGSTITADLLIGADGLNSRVRLLLDAQAAAPRYAGQRVFYGYTTKAEAPTAPGRITMVRGSGSAFGYTVSPTGETMWFARQTAEPLPAGQLGAAPSAELLDELLTSLQQDATPAADIVGATLSDTSDGSDILVTNATDLPDIATWSSERLLLIGDAAHAASPATGQGASMAMEDAVVLAKALRDSETQQAALELYEQVRRPRTQRNMAASAAMTSAAMTGRPSSTPRPPGGPSPEEEAALRRQLDWDTPLSEY